MEHPVVSGIAYARDEAKISIRHLPDRPGVAHSVFKPLAEPSSSRQLPRRFPCRTTPLR